MISHGRVIGTRGALIEAELLGASLGQIVCFKTGGHYVAGTIQGLEGNTAFIAPHADAAGIRNGAEVRADSYIGRIPLGMCALGRGFDASGNAFDGGPPIRGPMTSIFAAVTSVEERVPVAVPLWTGVKAIDTLLTIGRGARIGVFGSPGVGKSCLLETIVAGTSADAVVIGLIGERGREAEKWMASLDTRISIVCATSDRTAAERIRAAEVTIAHARALALRGLDVLVVFDSLARYAAALREVAVSAGESAGRGGYPASVFARLAQLVERCGALRNGSITLVATVLNDGDDRDPVSESARSLLDGHIQLSAPLAHAGRFPAIDVVQSASRTMGSVVDPRHARAAALVRGALALLNQVADARALGIEPVDASTLAAISVESRLEQLLRQGRRAVPAAEALRILLEIADTLGELHGHSD